MRPLEPFVVALDGNRLIEASAGTGKTYTITTLFLRLLVERGLGVDQILVVTFTKAATAELRDRIRQRLRAAVAAFDSDVPPDDDVLRGLREAAPDPRAARRHLAGELRRFDEAAIFTIHGFCQRMLRDNAFESGLVFDAELVTDAGPLRTEVVQDFWAREVYDAPERFARHLVDRAVSPDKLLDLAAQAVADPELVVIPARAGAEVSLEAVEPRYLAAHAAAADLWREEAATVTELIHSYPGLNRRRWSRSTSERRLGELATLLTTDSPPNALFPDFVRFTPGRMAGDTKKNHDPLVHPVFAACEELLGANAALVAALDARLMSLRLDLMDYARQEVRRRREASRTLSYDDLLHQLERALRGAGGADLGRIIRGRFRAALIDEFQDTDPVQDRIFREIFTDRETLFLIGDPKQAIYGFRRADIYTYLGAGARVRRAHADADDATDGCYTLDVNWRADPSLITAVNTLHRRARAPFLDDRIGFDPVRPAPKREDGLAGTGRHARALDLVFLSRERIGADPARPINKGWAVANLPGLVAAEIARLLASDTTLEERPVGGPRLSEHPPERRPLVPGDIAVLIRRNAEAAPLQEALRSLCIPSVVHSDASVVQTAEAEDLERVARGLAEPTRDGLVRAALATSLFGLSAEELERLGADEDAWQEWTERFEGWARKWRSRGFMVAFRSLLESQRVPERLLGLPDGERRLTNLLHLAELLHQAAATERLGPDGLAHWLGHQRAETDEGGGGDDTRQMRMESDARAVQILTLHKSKGLEYPVVFCPYLWDAGRQPGGADPVRFHDPADDHRVKLDLGSADLAEHHALAAREALSERLRVTYVALTRARHRAVVVWGAFRDTEKTGLAYLMHQPDIGVDDLAGDDLAAEVQRRVRGASDEDLRADLERLAAAADGTIVVHDLVDGDDDDGDDAEPVYVAESQPLQALEARTFRRALDRTWRTASFSALASTRPTLSHAAAEGRDLDEADAPAESEPATGPVADAPPVILHDFPRGARAGNLVHAIFEQVDFTRPDTVGPLVRGLLPRFGYDPRWADVLERAVVATLATPLDAAQGPRLGDVATDHRMVELEFVFPVAQDTARGTASLGAQGRIPVDVRGLSDAFAAHGPATLAGYAAHLADLRFLPVRGYLRGFIDLVFEHDERWYVVDYKSNHLGPSPADYAAGHLTRAMVSHHYPLQYHLYTLALHRYLGARLPGYDYDRCFGGVYYLFLRGMSPDRPGHGVFGDRPSRALVEALSALVDGREVHP